MKIKFVVYKNDEVKQGSPIEVTDGDLKEIWDAAKEFNKKSLEKNLNTRIEIVKLV